MDFAQTYWYHQVPLKHLKGIQEKGLVGRKASGVATHSGPHVTDECVYFRGNELGSLMWEFYSGQPRVQLRVKGIDGSKVALDPEYVGVYNDGWAQAGIEEDSDDPMDRAGVMLRDLLVEMGTSMGEIMRDDSRVPEVIERMPDELREWFYERVLYDEASAAIIYYGEVLPHELEIDNKRDKTWMPLDDFDFSIEHITQVDLELGWSKEQPDAPTLQGWQYRAEPPLTLEKQRDRYKEFGIAMI